jgi:uncharacterized protein (TIGR02271 family)
MSTNSNIDWNSVIKKEAVGTGGIDLGTIYGVENAYITTQKGLRDKKRYHIPKSLVENFDGIVLRLKVNESEMLKYEKTEDKKYENNTSSFKSLYESKDIETTIPLMAENLKVTKNIAEDNLNITKEPIRETKTVQVKLTHEEILIERRPVKEDSYSYISSMQSSEEKPLSLSPIGGQVEKRTEISIPLKREEATITKTPYVKEEIVIKKKPVTETKEVSEETTSEKIKTSDIK